LPTLAVIIFLVSTIGFGRVPGFLGPVGALLNAEPLLKRSGIELRDLNGADPRRYDSLGYYPRIADFAGAGAELVGISLAGVRSDGTIDLTVAGANHQATYTFQRALRQPEAGRAAGQGLYEPIEVWVQRPGQRRSVGSGAGRGGGIQYVTRGIQKTTDEATTQRDGPLPMPACSLRDFWREAIAHGAPAGAVASIQYGEDGYQLWVAEAGLRLTFDHDCRDTTE
jgi:hypothetical protein